MRTRIIADEVFYPSGDGQPMAETGIHVQAIILLHQALQDFFQSRPDVFIASDMFWYYLQGTRKRIAPDVMVVPGVGDHQRRSFFSWKEPETPAVVFEMASAKTWKKDLTVKYRRYESLGVREYFIFDPEDRYLEQPLIGFRLNRSKYRRIRREMASDLGFRMQVEGTMLRLIDDQTGQQVPTRAEAIVTERSKTAAEKARADALEAEVQRLKMLLGEGSP
jgi:Uma2 family endonuclease